MNCKERLWNLLTICRKAGKMTMGLEPAKSAAMGGYAAGILVVTDASERSKKEARYFAQQYKISVSEIPFTKLEMAQAVGRAAGVYAVCDNGFYNKIKQLSDTCAVQGSVQNEGKED